MDGGAIAALVISLLGGVLSLGGSIGKGVEDSKRIKEEQRQTRIEEAREKEKLARQSRIEEGAMRAFQGASEFAPDSATYLQNLFGVRDDYQEVINQVKVDSQRKQYQLEEERKSSVAASTLGALQSVLGMAVTGVTQGMDIDEKYGQEIASYFSNKKDARLEKNLAKQTAKYVSEKEWQYKTSSIKSNNRSF